MTNESRNPKPNPYGSLPPVPTFSLTVQLSYEALAPAEPRGGQS